MADLSEIFRPNKYLGRDEPEHFDPNVHTAGVIDWLALGNKNPNFFMEKIGIIVKASGFRPLQTFSTEYIAPDTYEPVERHSAAVRFLGKAGVSEVALADLNGELEWSQQKLDAGKGTLRAAIRAEALARGEYDPAALILDDTIRQARDL